MDNGPQPVAKVSGISGIVSVGLGGMHSVALEGTKVIGWGANDAAQLGYMGNGSPAPNSQSAQNGEAISAGGAHTCAVSSSALRCWGRNQEGQLGIGFAGGPALPTLVDLNDQPVADVACGEGHTCIRMDGGDVLCWGFNVEGQLGNGGIVSSSAAGEPVQIGGSATSIAAGNAHTGAISNNDLYLWGRNTQGEILSNQLALIVSTPTKIGNLHNVRKAALGSQHSCVLDKSGNPVHVVCWGGNSDGQVGNGAIGGDHKAAAEVAFP
jgi:alpha-tubulin suppressor-like RCC1 family protein